MATHCKIPLLHFGHPADLPWYDHERTNEQKRKSIVVRTPSHNFVDRFVTAAGSFVTARHRYAKRHAISHSKPRPAGTWDPACCYMVNVNLERRRESKKRGTPSRLFPVKTSTTTTTTPLTNRRNRKETGCAARCKRVAYMRAGTRPDFPLRL